ncbi:unnamed protein product [Sphenostylis stenocarpa]|uniref:Uncharacterized protein n=1 Tax=Sphenostylis stenocarpa TaxID=92480 RepID=A0AA86SMV9_9FABA|nr:unnamed protein product [Sphenostylis stenocarpa]
MLNTCLCDDKSVCNLIKSMCKQFKEESQTPNSSVAASTLKNKLERIKSERQVQRNLKEMRIRKNILPQMIKKKHYTEMMN